MAAAGDTVARALVDSAFSLAAVEGTPDVECAAVAAVPFLLDPISALRTGGQVSGAATSLCVRVVATYVVGVASRVCGHLADGLASSLSPWLSLPPGYGVKAFLPPGRSAAQDAVAAECTLLGGVCVCDLSAPRGAEADALAGMA